MSRIGPKPGSSFEHVPTRDEAHAGLSESGVHSARLGDHDAVPPRSNSSPQDRVNDYNSNKTKQDKVSKLAQLTALGITLAVAAKITLSSMNKWLATNNAKIKITSITPDSALPSWLPGFFLDFLRKYIKSQKLRIAYTVTSVGTDDNAIPDVFAKKSDVNLTKYDTISIDAGSTGLAYLDGQTIAIERVISQGLFVFDAKTDVTTVNVVNKGTGKINSSYDEQLGDQIANTASDIGSEVNKVLSPLMQNWGTILFYIIFGVIIYFIIQVVSSFSR